MRNFILRLSLLSLFALISGSVLSQTLTLNAPSRIAVNQPFRVEYRSDVKPDQFSGPTFPDAFNVIANASLSQSSSTTIINGKVSTESSYIYTYVISALKEGIHTIPAAKIVVKGKTYSSKSSPIEVVSTSSNTNQTQQQSNKSAQNNITSVGREDLFARIETNKKEVYIGEAVLASIKLYTRVNIAGLEKEKYPPFTGFWTQNLPTDNFDWQRETVNGKVYETRIIKQYLLYPQKSGKIKIENLELDIVARIETAPAQGSPSSAFDVFFGGSTTRYENIVKKITAPIVYVDVKPLPVNTPENFSGAVGDFSLTSELVSANQVSANSAITLKLRIKGTGNLPLIEAPKLSLPESFEIYTPKNEDQFINTSNGSVGEKIFEYTIIPRAEGKYEIPSLEFTYFNPNKNAYHKSYSDKINITVTRDNSAAGTQTGSITTSSKETPQLLSSEIRFIKSGDPKLKKETGLFLFSWGYFITIFVLIGLFTATIIYLQKQIKLRSDAVKFKNKKASRIAVRRLKTAKKHLDDNCKAEFYVEILKALWGYVGDKMNIPVANLSKDNIDISLESAGINTEIRKRLLSVIEECEFAQYAPSAEGKMEEIYKESEEIIEIIESEIRSN